jgi:hypothetical protein
MAKTAYAIDSSDTTGWLNPLQLHAYHRDGFLLIPSVFTPSEISTIHSAFLRLNERSQSLTQDATIETSRFVVRPAPETSEYAMATHRVVWAGGAEPVLDRFGHDSRLLRFASSILETETIVQLINQAHFKYPGDGVAFPWHQDSKHRRQGTDRFRDLNGKGSFVETITAIDPMTLDNGPLEVLVGSHIAGHLGDGDGYAAQLPELLKQYESKTIVMDAGDVLLVSPFTTHRSLPNMGSTSRFAYLNGFALPGANRRIYPGCGLGRFRRLDIETT